jgi:hypothetical protein
MSHENDELFSLAVKMLREGRHSSLQVIDAVEYAATGNFDAREIVYKAQTYLTELQTKAFDAAVEAFRRGETQLEVEKKLRALGFQSWDASVVAGRAIAKALAEETQNAADD